MAEIFRKPDSVWPYVRYSDGTELSNGSRIYARSLKEFVAERGGKLKPRRVKVGERVLIVLKIDRLVLGKVGTGNYNFHEVAEDVEEGVDFELIKGKAEVEFDEAAWRANLKPIFSWEKA